MNEPSCVVTVMPVGVGNILSKRGQLVSIS